MKRTKVRDEKGNEKLTFRKTRGTLLLGKRVIDASNGPVKFKARPDEIPPAFRDTIECLDTIPEEQPVASATKFEVVHTGGGWYNVVEVTSGKAMNESKLRQADAQQLLERLQ